ncbi:hypothetical protein AB0H73_06355 [Streptomyces olivoreticuli]
MKVGDMVRVVLEVDDGFKEHHYGRIRQFRKADGQNYRRKVAKPHSAYVDLDHAVSGRIVPLAEITPEADDFEIITDYSEVHRGAAEYMDWYYKCLECGGYAYKPAEVKVIHKASGQCVRLCADCNTDNRRAQLGHSMMWDQRRNKEAILRLIEAPELIVGPVDDYDADVYRQWADVFPYLVPERAADLYEQWKTAHVQR